MAKFLSFSDSIRQVNLGNSYIENTLHIKDVILQCIESICEYNESVLSFCYELADKHRNILLYVNDKLKIEFDINRAKYKGYVAFISITHCLENDDAALLLIRKFNFDQLEKLLNINSNRKYSSRHAYYNRNPKVIGPDVITLQGKSFSKSKEILFTNYSGGVDFCAIPYVNGEEYFILPFTLYEKNVERNTDYYLAPGLPDSKCLLLNAHVLNLKKNMKVFLFENLRMAVEFQSRIDDSQSISKDNHVSTSNYGGVSAINSVEFSPIRGQDVYFIPNPSKVGYLNVREYYEKCIAAGANKFMVVIEPHLEYPKHGEKEDYESFSCPFERYVAKTAYCCRDHELFFIVNRIMKYSINPSEYLQWAHSMMLIEDPVASQESGLRSIVKNIGELVRSPFLEQRSSSFSLDQLLGPKKLMEIIGYSNSGKTMTGSSLLVALSDGNDVFMFKNNTPKRILLVDCETGESNLQQIYMQCKQIIASKKSSLDNIDYISLLDSGDKYDFSITSQETQADLIKFFKSSNYDLLVIDNLQSLSSIISFSPSKWDIVYKFFQKLHSLGVAVLVFHHTPESNKTKALGISRLTESFQTIMVLEGPDSFKNEQNKEKINEDPFVVKYVDQPGTFVRISFNKCKPDPRLEKLTFQYHLPFVDVTKSNAKHWIADPANYDHDHTDDLHDEVNFLNSLPKDAEIQVQDYPYSVRSDEFLRNCNLIIDYADEHPDFNGVQIQKAFSLRKRYVKKILDHLVESSVLDRSGSTSTTKYRLRLDYNKN